MGLLLQQHLMHKPCQAPLSDTQLSQSPGSVPDIRAAPEATRISGAEKPDLRVIRQASLSHPKWAVRTNAGYLCARATLLAESGQMPGKSVEMKPTRHLTPPPIVDLERVGEASGPPFLTITRQELRAIYPNGEQSRPFAYDSVGRRALDAVVIVAWEHVEGEVCIYLRSGVRPPLLERRQHPAAGDRQSNPGLWELPAGLIEPSDFENTTSPQAGILVAAARELREELGFVTPPHTLRTLGHGVFPSPAMTAEKQFFVSVNVTGQIRHEPALDGSPLEEHAEILLVPLSCALTFCEDGHITDAKTELALRRLSASNLD